MRFQYAAASIRRQSLRQDRIAVEIDRAAGRASRRKMSAQARGRGAVRQRADDGGMSIIGLKSYATGREKFQGETLDFVWLDEEPPIDIYTEALTRTNVGASPVWMTFTPLLGVSEVVRRFLHEKSDDRYKVVMTIDDVGHYSDHEKQT